MNRMKLILSFFMIYFLGPQYSWGHYDFEFSGKESDWIEFEVSSKEIKSLQFNFEVIGGKKTFIRDLVAPNGKVIIKSNYATPSSQRIPPWIYSTIGNKVRPTYVVDGLFSIIVNDSINGMDNKTGMWKLRLVDGNGQSNKKVFIHKNTLTREEATLQKGMKIKLHHQGLIDPLALELAIEDLEKIYRDYGLSIDIVIKDNWQDPLEETNDLEKKIQEFTKGRRNEVQIYLFSRGKVSDQKDFQGLASCLPGFISQKIDKHCALAIGFTPRVEINFNKLKKVVGHELAHYLGLFHLEDDYYPFGRRDDGLEDTHSGNESSNFMHKTSEYFEVIEFTSQQITKMLSHPELF
tara:strand:+ start:128452 stop:129501 length:1050 start_codon:yes stop_codon:yes gene_type:complete